MVESMEKMLIFGKKGSKYTRYTIRLVFLQNFSEKLCLTPTIIHYITYTPYPLQDITAYCTFLRPKANLTLSSYGYNALLELILL